MEFHHIALYFIHFDIRYDEILWGKFVVVPRKEEIKFLGSKA